MPPRSAKPIASARKVSTPSTRKTVTLVATEFGGACECSKTIGFCSACMFALSPLEPQVGRRVVAHHVKQRQQEDPHQFHEVPVQRQHFDVHVALSRYEKASARQDVLPDEDVDADDQVNA